MKNSLILCVSLTAMAAAMPAAAQQTNDENQPAARTRNVDEIIVTSERREESIQDVSGVVQSFTGEDLKRLGVTSDIRTLQAVVPGLNIANQEGNIEIYIRGVGSSNNTELGDPAASPHINGVYIARPRGLGVQFYDLERVEVNKGPQGTLRGRNALAGTLNIITHKPELGNLGGYLEAGIGNYDQRTAEGAINLPVGDDAAIRFAAFSNYHDSYFNNGGLDKSLTPAGVTDELGGRLSGLWKPSDRLTVELVADYTDEGGTGYPGSNLFPAFTSTPNGGTFEDYKDEVRDVVYRGHQGKLDSETWGVMARAQYDFDAFSVEYTASRRFVDFTQTNAENNSIAWDGRDLSDANINYDNYSNNFWLTRSWSNIHEGRIFAPEGARLNWTAGVFYFEETQDVGLISSNDFGNFYSGTEFTMPDVDSQSIAGYADATFNVTDRFRVFGGIRYTDEEKYRFGIGGNFAAGFGSDGFGCCFLTRFATEGFVPNFMGRDTFQAPTTREEAIAFWLDAAAQYGIYDTYQQQLSGTLDGTAPNGLCVDTEDTNPGGSLACPADGMNSFLSIYPEQATPAQQIGNYKDNFFDWRAGFEFDWAPQSMVYAKATTGHKSGGFNDTLPNIGSLTYDPEEVIAYEIGSRNQFDMGGASITLNASGFYYDYSDQVFQVLTAFGPPPAPNQAPPQSLLNINVADSSILGAEFEARAALDYGFTASAQLLLLDAKIDEGTISDIRAQDYGNAANTPDADLADNKLPLASDFSFTATLQQVFDLMGGQADWQVVGSYRSDYFLSVYNEQDVQYRDGTTGDAIALGFSDKQEGFWTVNLGVGWTPNDSRFRVEGYITNLFNEEVSQKGLYGPGLNIRFLNTPRTGGVRLRVNF